MISRWTWNSDSQQSVITCIHVFGTSVVVWRAANVSNAWMQRILIAKNWNPFLILICFWIDPLHMTGFRWKITPCKTSWAWSCWKYFCIVDRNGGNRSFPFDRVCRCSSEKIGGGDEFSLEIIFIILVCNFSGILQMKMSQIRFYDLCDCN
jgi:hypothetical protein